jgi:exosome complex exonuclease DIS3/RRP44
MTTVATPITPVNGMRPAITILKRTRADLALSQTKFLKKTAKGKVLNCK